MTTVGAGERVPPLERVRQAERDGLLAVGKMGRSADQVLQEQLLHSRLEKADLDHRPVHGHQGVVR